MTKGPNGTPSVESEAAAMKLLTFSFKNEAIWTVVFALAPIAAALFILLLVYLARSLF
jgi:hypothetical protein